MKKFSIKNYAVQEDTNKEVVIERYYDTDTERWVLVIDHIMHNTEAKRTLDLKEEIREWMAFYRLAWK